MDSHTQMSTCCIGILRHCALMCSGVKGCFSSAEATPNVAALSAELEQMRGTHAQTLKKLDEALRGIAELRRTETTSKSQQPILKKIRVSNVCEDDPESKRIRIECPGADEDSISIEGLPNGVRVRIEVLSDEQAAHDAFEQEFSYD